MPTYRIRPGHSFRDSDGSTKSGGDLIELGEDIAQLHADKVEPAESAPLAPQPGEPE